MASRQQQSIEPLRIRKVADTDSGEQRIPMLVLPNVPVSRASLEHALAEADDDAEYVTLPQLALAPPQMERRLVNPATPGFDHEPWPPAGIRIEGEPPARTRIATSFVDNALREGADLEQPWLELVNDRVVHKPGGSADRPWSVTHTFVHADEIVLRTLDGDVRYRVTRQPDKYDGGPENGTGEPTDAAGDPETSVDWFYEAELVEA